MRHTYFVVQPFKIGQGNKLVADQPREVKTLEAAEHLAERLAGSFAGVLAFSRSGDQFTGDYDDAVLVARHGRVPDELLEAVA